MRHIIAERGLQECLFIDSAGTTAFHSGEAPDKRSVAHAKKRGIFIEDLRSRKINLKDFEEFDLILALDQEHFDFLQRMKPAQAKAEVVLFLVYAGVEQVREVPDPYYGEAHHFEYVLDLIASGVKPLIDKLQQQLR